MRREGKSRRLACGLRLWPLGLAGLGSLVAANAHHTGLRINWTASAPIGFYRERPLRIALGELALVCLPSAVEDVGRRRGYIPAGDCPGGSSPALKQIAGLPGDTVAVGEAFLAVNGRVLLEAVVQRSDSSGRPLEHAPFGSHVLPPDRVWVMGLNPARSWDSRYFGPIPIESLVGSARPLLTINLRQP